jgi:hypothetical protein
MTYLIANTPRFLIRELKRLAGYAAFVRENETSALVDYIKGVDESADRDPEKVGLAYTAAAALTDKDAKSLAAFLASRPMQNLVWMSDLSAIGAELRIPTSVVSSFAGSKPAVITQGGSGNTGIPTNVTLFTVEK